MAAKRIFGVSCACDIFEHFTMLYPQKIDTFLFKFKVHPTKRPSLAHSGRRDHVRVLLTLPKPSKGKYWNPALSTYLDFFVHSLLFFAMLPGLLLFYSTFIFITPPFFATLSTPILRIFRKRIVLVVFDAWVEVAQTSAELAGKLTLFKRIELKIGRALEILAAKNASEIFAVSKYLFDLNKQYNDRVYWTPTGADVRKTEAITKRRMFDVPTIVYMGGIEKWRGIDLLIDAFKIVRKKKKAKLLIMGGGTAFEDVKKYAGADPDIRFMGQIAHDTAISYIKGSEVATVPHRKCLVSQTVSTLKLFEYIACEVPSVVTDSGEHVYWIKKYGTGIVVEDTPEGIANGILTLLSDKKLYKSLKENCRKHKQNVDFKKNREVYVKKLSE